MRVAGILAWVAFTPASARPLSLRQSTPREEPSTKPLLDASEIAPKPPSFANQWHASFVETTRTFNPFKTPARNKGALHYDWTHQRLLYEHGQGQSDNWCQCAGVAKGEQCNILFAKNEFAPNGGLFAMHPNLNSCCQIAKWTDGSGFGIHPAPDWLQTGMKDGLVTVTEEQVNGVNVTTWSWNKPGDRFMMVSDDWSVDEMGVPRRYKDHFKRWAVAIGMLHEMNFEDGTYSEDTEADAVFAIPDGMDCTKRCPNKKGWCKAT